MKIVSDILHIELSAHQSFEKRNFEEIKAAFLFAQNNNIRKIIFPSGTFFVSNNIAEVQMEKMLGAEFKRREVQNVMASLDGASDIEIEGNNSTLIFRGIIAPFDFYRCNNITVKNITIDWERPVFSIGTAEKISSGEITVRFDEEYALKGGEPVVSYQDYDAESGGFSGFCIFEGVEKLEKTSEQTVLLKNEFASAVKKGNRVIMRHIYSFAPCFHLLECANFTFCGVVIHTAPGMGIICHKSADLSFENLCVQPSHGRLLSTNTDATHFISCFGRISFNKCFFSFMGDDAVNVHGFYLAVKEKKSSRELILTVESSIQDDVFDSPQHLDKVEFVKRDTLYPYAEAKIIEVKDIDAENNTVRVTFDRDLPENFELTDVIANASKTASLTFSNCTVKNIRGRALLIQTRNAVVENCLFENCTGQGVHINTAAGWWESIGTRNIIVRRNRFLNCGYGSTKYCDSVGVVIETECSVLKTGVHKNTEISDNYIEGSNTGILVRCADSVKIKNNFFFLDEKFNQVDIDYSDNVEISGGNLLKHKIKTGHNAFNVSVKA